MLTRLSVYPTHSKIRRSCVVNEHPSVMKSFVISQFMTEESSSPAAAHLQKENSSAKVEIPTTACHVTPHSSCFHKSHLLLILIGDHTYTHTHTHTPIKYCSSNDEFSMLFVQSRFIANLIRVTKLYISNQTLDELWAP